MTKDKWAALIRAVRTFLQALIAAGLVAGWEAVQNNLGNTGWDPQKIITLFVSAAIAGVVGFLFNLFNQVSPEKPKDTRSDKLV